MRQATRKFVLGAAVLAALASVQKLSAQVGPATPPAEQHPAAHEQQAVPIREVVLFTSGVGYFEHFGVVHGNASADLSFKTDQINDILKSLLLEDTDGGKISTVTYGSQEPLARTLKSFQIDLSASPALSQILAQLRGTSVTAMLADGKMSGTILGVEKKQKPVGEGKMVDVWVLDLLQADGNIRPIDFDRIDQIHLDDPRLEQELVKALAAVAAARDQDKKPVTIHFNGVGDRHVRIGYVVEAPVWKASYRLVLSPDAKNEDPNSKQEPKEDGLQKNNNPRQNKAADGGTLQGWAIVENQTDSDWDNIQLSLVSGRPISFIENLYQPLYVPRQVVQPELYASLQPQTYEEGIQQQQLGRVMRARRLAQAPTPGSAGGLFGNSNAPQDREALSDLAAARPLNPLASVLPAASGATIGQFFEYTIPDVNLPRQKSALIPILTDGVKARRLSIYNRSVLASNPLLGARLTNTTGKLLPQGPLTVLDAGSYAGDAKIDDLPNGQNRLVSYGIDQAVLVHSDEQTENSSVVTAKIIKGVLEVTHKQVFKQKYVADNKGKTEKTLLIEHPRRMGWTLVDLKPIETTDRLYRFEETLPAEKTTTLQVEEQLVSAQGMAILPMDDPTIESYRTTGEIPPAVKDALAKAAQMKSAVADTGRQIADRQQRLNEFSNEQARIRENMKAVDQNTDYYKRLLKELDQQETTIEQLHTDIKSLQEKMRSQQKQLEDYLSTLDVG